MTEAGMKSLASGWPSVDSGIDAAPAAAAAAARSFWEVDNSSLQRLQFLRDRTIRSHCNTEKLKCFVQKAFPRSGDIWKAARPSTLRGLALQAHLRATNSC